MVRRGCRLALLCGLAGASAAAVPRLAGAAEEHAPGLRGAARRLQGTSLSPYCVLCPSMCDTDTVRASTSGTSWRSSLSTTSRSAVSTSTGTSTTSTIPDIWMPFPSMFDTSALTETTSATSLSACCVFFPAMCGTIALTETTLTTTFSGSKEEVHVTLTTTLPGDLLQVLADLLKIYPAPQGTTCLGAKEEVHVTLTTTLPGDLLQVLGDLLKIDLAPQGCIREVVTASGTHSLASQGVFRSFIIVVPSDRAAASVIEAIWKSPDFVVTSVATVALTSPVAPGASVKQDAAMATTALTETTLTTTCSGAKEEVHVTLTTTLTGDLLQVLADLLKIDPAPQGCIREVVTASGTHSLASQGGFRSFIIVVPSDRAAASVIEAIWKSPDFVVTSIATVALTSSEKQDAAMGLLMAMFLCSGLTVIVGGPLLYVLVLRRKESAVAPAQPTECVVGRGKGAQR